jgi:hypothetical protein
MDVYGATINGTRFIKQTTHRQGKHMQLHRLLIATAIVVTLSSPAFAQSTTNTTTSANPDTSVQRDANQQERIEQGLQSGQLSTKEAGKLEKGETAIEHQEAKDMKNGSVSPQEQQQLNRMENRESSAIYNQKHDAQTGNPNSASSQRMQADVQRDANQQQRISNGVNNGSMTTREAAGSERGQMRNTRLEARAARNGRVGRGEQARIQRSENVRSRNIYRRKHNARTDAPAAAPAATN